MVIEAREVRVRFSRGPFRPPFTALDGFSIDVRAGDIFALLGPNGAGKSTALYCLLGLLRPESGAVRVLGETPERGAPLFDRIAYLPEEPHYHLFLTVLEAVTFYASLGRRPPSRSEIDDALEKFALSRFRDLKLEKCSKGMKQKAGLAAVFLARPEVVFLDEPTRGLDPETVNDVRASLQELSKGGSTVFMNSHVLSEVEAVCNRVAIMDRGRVIAADEVSRLRAVSSDEYDVEMDPAPELPDFFSVTDRRPDAVLGRVPRSRLKDLLAHAEARNAVVRSCAIRRRSLEDAFLAKLRENRP